MNENNKKIKEKTISIKLKLDTKEFEEGLNRLEVKLKRIRDLMDFSKILNIEEEVMEMNPLKDMLEFEKSLKEVKDIIGRPYD